MRTSQSLGQVRLSPAPSLKVLVCTRFYAPAFKGGGPIQTLRALIQAAPEHLEISVICSNHDLGDASALTNHPNEWVNLDRPRVRYVQGRIRTLIDAYRSVGDVDVVYLNSLFDPLYSVLPLALVRLGFWNKATCGLAPRGELSPGALKLKPRKKAIFLSLSRLFGLHRNVIWHASTQLEADHIRAVFGRSARIRIRENETSLPVRSRMRKPRPEGPLKVLFASRISPKKGLLTLLEALVGVQGRLQVNVVGAFEDSAYEAKCRSVIATLPDAITVRLKGALPHSAVLEEMRNADIMAFPTAGENFGHVIAEALSEGCPVLVSSHTPWSRRLARRAGGAVDPNTPQAWTAAINALLARGSGEWQRESRAAADVYEEWASEDKGTHIFQSLLPVSPGKRY